MCSRYELNTPPERMIERFGLRVPESTGGSWPVRAFERGEIRPTNLAPVVFPGGELKMQPWGLSVSWQAQPLINARGETLDRKPTFRPLIERRCVVPASAYFEWRREDKAKVKTRIAIAGDVLMAFAGLTDGERFTIVTCEPSPSIAYIHDRMPAILDRASSDAWLDPNRRFADVRPLLAPFRGQLICAEQPSRKSRQQPGLFD